MRLLLVVEALLKPGLRAIPAAMVVMVVMANLV
jgi:hypothetical protein